MPVPVYPESVDPDSAELSLANVVLATEIISAIRGQRPHDPQVQAMTVNQLIRMQLIELVSRLRTTIPDYFPKGFSIPAEDDFEEENGKLGSSDAPREKRKYTRRVPLA